MAAKFFKGDKLKTVLKRLPRAMLFLVPAAVALILYKVLPQFPEFVEKVFSRGIFRLIGTPLGFVTSRLGVSLTEILVVLALPAFVAYVAIFVIKIVRSHNKKSIVINHLKIIGWSLSLVLLMYMLMHGFNFFRLPVSTLLDLDTSQKTPELLQQLCIDLAKKATLERENLSENAEGCTILSQSLNNTLKKAGDGYKEIDDRYKFLKGAVTRAKPVRLSHWWSYTGISGMYMPFFAEANVNIDQPDSAIPATAAHELAHTRGFAREDECNFFACLSCFHHPSADYRYSGTLMAYIYCSNALYSYDEELLETAREQCSEGVIRDINERNQYWKQFEGKVQKTSEKINDSFIQSHGVEDGVLSYNRIVELLLAYYEKKGLPVVSG